MGAMTTRHNDPEAIRLWRRAGRSRDLRWLLDGLLKNRNLGRILLLSPPEFFGEVQVPAGRLSFQFRLLDSHISATACKSCSQL